MRFLVKKQIKYQKKRSREMKNLLKSFLVIFVLVLILAAAYLGYRKYAGNDEKTVFITEKAVKSDIMRSISATGTVEPEELVNVGAQVQGMIAKFGTPHCAAVGVQTYGDLLMLASNLMFWMVFRRSLP